jgi:hypothetical protein
VQPPAHEGDSLRAPGFPVESRGFDDLHAALFTERRTGGRRWQREVGNPGTRGFS